MKNVLRPYEAVAVALLNKPNKTSTFEEIAQEMEKKNLFPERREDIILAQQIKLRILISSSRYKHFNANDTK